MPTGYTADLYDGKDVTLEEFLLKGARGFGAAIMLRDSDPDILPTEENVIEPEGYYDNRLKALEAEYEQVKNMTVTEAYNQQVDRVAEIQKDNEKDRLKREALRNRYEAMLTQVALWDAPETHREFKNSMIAQLKSSIEFDTKEFEWPEPLLISGAEYKFNLLKRIEADIKHTEEEIEKRNERNAERVEWVRALRNSLA